MLKDKNIIITGGTGLIGKSILKQIIDWNGIAINLDINPSEIERVIDLNCNISIQQEFDDILKGIISRYKRIDGLINCAYPKSNDWGMHSFEELPITSWKENVDLQLNSYFYTCQQVLKHMKNNRNGSIVNLASIYGSLGNDFTLYKGLDINPPAAYSAIKGGIINFTRYLASYYGKFNITVNCVSPGGIYDDQNPVFVKRYEKHVPARRMGKPDDIAPIVAFLLTKNAKYINGQNILVDGGWSII